MIANNKTIIQNLKKVKRQNKYTTIAFIYLRQEFMTNETISILKL